LLGWLGELMAGRSEAWRSYAAGSEVKHFADFCKEHLIQSEDRWEGKPLLLEPWQRRMLGEALAFDARGWPIWRSVVMVAPRKNGKTCLLSAYALYRLLTGEGRPEILLAASSDRQAGRLFDAAARFVRRSEELSALLRVRDHEGSMVREDAMGTIIRLTSDPARLYGYSPTLVVCDELAWWTTPNLRRAYAALTSGGGARRAPQTFTITTAGEAATRHDGILGQILDAALDAEDVAREPGLTVARMPRSETLVWAYEAPASDPHDLKAMKLANPASWVTRAYLKRQAENPELTDAQVLQLHGCVWAATSSTWIAPDAWTACTSPTRALQDGEQVVLGFDGSYRRDATALAGHAEIEGWRDRYGSVVVDFPTNERRRMAAACDRFRVAVLEGDLTHDGDPALARHVGHCVAKDTPYGTIIGKEHPDSPRKIDAAVAAVVAFERAAWHQSRTSDLPLVVFT
jgi:phage terminase large subunit-like protein